MDQSQFLAQINRLSSTYGARNYPQERVTLIAKMVHEFPVSWLKHLVDEFIGKSRTAPMPDDFQQAVWAMRSAQKRASPENDWSGFDPARNPSCYSCRDSGIIIAESRILKTGSFGFRCDCERGRSKQSALPMWSAHSQLHFENLTASPSMCTTVETKKVGENDRNRRPSGDSEAEIRSPSEVDHCTV